MANRADRIEHSVFTCWKRNRDMPAGVLRTTSSGRVAERHHSRSVDREKDQKHKNRILAV